MQDPALVAAVAADIRLLRRATRGDGIAWNNASVLNFLMSLGLTQPDPAERRALLRLALPACYCVIP